MDAWGPVIMDDALDFVDTLSWKDLLFFSQTLKPNKATADGWHFVQQVVLDVKNTGRVDTALKLHLLSVSLCFSPVPEEWRDSGKSTNLLILLRMAAFRRGEFQSLYQESRVQAAVSSVRPPQPAAPAPFSVVPEQTLKRARLKAQAGQARSAAQTLMGVPLLKPSDPQVQEYLQAQYTPTYVPELIPPVPPGFSPALWRVGEIEVSESAARSDGPSRSPVMVVDACAWVQAHLPALRAQDQFGFRYEHYSSLDTSFVSWLVECFYNAQFPIASHAIISSAIGFCPDKGGGVPRGVHSVMILRKIAGRIAMVQDRKVIRDDFVKVGQFGVAVSGGVEYVYHCNRLALLAAFDSADPLDPGVRASLRDDPLQPAAGQTDFEAAFPNVFQSKIIEGLEHHPDGLYVSHSRCARMLYECSPSVFFIENGKVVYTADVVSGSHQGCPLAGFHFGVAIRPMCLNLQQAVAPHKVMCSWIMDDCSFAGSLMGLAVGYQCLAENAPRYGLRLKGLPDPGRSKLKLYVPCADPEWVSGVPVLSLDASMGQADTHAALSLLKDHLFVVSNDGLKRVLGAPLSLDPDFVSGWVHKAVKETCVLLDRIPQLMCPASQWLLLKFCGATRALHLTRMLYPDDLEGPLLVSDAAQRKCFESIVQGDVSDDQWTQVKLPTRHAGCGLSDALSIRPAATLASAHATAVILTQVHEANNLSFYSSMLDALVQQPCLISAHALLNEVAVDVGASSDALLPPLTELNSKKWPVQQRISDVLHLSHGKALLEKVKCYDLEWAAWLKSCAQFGSGTWLHSVPTLDCFQCTDDEFCVMMRLRLKMDMLAASALAVPECKCGAAHSARVENGGHYHCGCSAVSALRTARHDRVRDDVFHLCKESGFGDVRLEPNGLAGDGSFARPADVLIPAVKGKAGVRSARDRYRSLDVVVCDPCSAANIAEGSASYSLIAAKSADESKMKAHGFLMASAGVGFLPTEKVPLSVESSGAWGLGLRELWKEAKLMHREHTGGLSYARQGKPFTWTAFSFEQYWPQRISFAVARFTAQMVIGGLGRSRRFLRVGA
jgi:hypothetical protein